MNAAPGRRAVVVLSLFLAGGVAPLACWPGVALSACAIVWRSPGEHRALHRVPQIIA
jgi:hypothetical protein